jgi:ABC transport system ATP-binding/permease protein
VIVPEGNGKWVEYAGGYSDMLTQRGADVVRAAPKASAPKEKSEDKPAPSPSRTQKLSFKDKHALETLPAVIDGLHEEIAAHQKLLDDPQLYAKDRKRFDAVSAALVAAQTKLSEAEERWLELEMLREEIEGS